MVITRSEIISRKRIMKSAPSDGIQEPYLDTINLTTSEHLKLYKK